MRNRAKRQPVATPDAPWYEFRAQAADDPTCAELHIFGVIGASFWDPDAVSGKKIAQQLAELSEDVTTIRVFVNSPGGNVFDGQHIFNALRREREENNRSVEVDIEGMALSAATLVTSAGGPHISGASGTIRMPANAIFMVHNPYFWTMGDAAQLRKDADVLDRITNGIIATYKFCSELAGDALRTLMDDETWMEAADALANGLITEVVEAVGAQASFDPQLLDEHFDIPAEYRDRVMALLQPSGEESVAEEPNGETDDPSDADAAPSAEEPESESSEEDTPEEPAAAATIARLCREAGCFSLAERLIESCATEAAVNAQVDLAKRISALCVAAELPEMAEGYITNGVPEDAVREQLTAFTARMDSTEISGHIDPDARASAPKVMSPTDIYAARNKAHYETTRQEI